MQINTIYVMDFSIFIRMCACLGIGANILPNSDSIQTYFEPEILFGNVISK